MSLTNELIDILACPGCKGRLELKKDGNFLLCTSCDAQFEVQDGIPVFVASE